MESRLLTRPAFFLLMLLVVRLLGVNVGIILALRWYPIERYGGILLSARIGIQLSARIGILYAL